MAAMIHPDEEISALSVASSHGGIRFKLVGVHLPVLAPLRGRTERNLRLLGFEAGVEEVAFLRTPSTLSKGRLSTGVAGLGWVYIDG